MRTTPVRPSTIARSGSAGEVAGQVDLQALGYDRWRIEDLLSVLAQVGIELPLVPFGQGEMAPTRP